MLKAAQLYEQELNKNFWECSYDEKYKWYFINNGGGVELPRNSFDKVDLVCINGNGEVTGYFSYKIVWSDLRIYDLAIIGFTNNSAGLLIDVYKWIKDLLENKHFHKITFWAVKDNPANRIYEKLIEKLNGRVVGVFMDDIMIDGEYHDCVSYEIINKEW